MGVYRWAVSSERRGGWWRGGWWWGTLCQAAFLSRSPRLLLEGDGQCFVFEYALSVQWLWKELSSGTPSVEASVEGTICALTSALRHSLIRWNSQWKKEMSKEGLPESYECVTSHLMLSGINGRGCSHLYKSSQFYTLLIRTEDGRFDQD